MYTESHVSQLLHNGEKISGRLVQTMGIRQVNRKSQIIRAEHCFCIEISVPHGINIFPAIQSLKKKKKEK